MMIDDIKQLPRRQKKPTGCLQQNRQEEKVS
jgi:hypothetical protein